MSTPAVDYDGVPDWVTDGDEDISVGDMSAVPDNDVMPTFRNVLFDIRAASLDVQEFKLDDGSKCWAKKNLHLQLNVAQPGIDVDGVSKYANKAFFTNLLLMINREDFPDAFKYDRYAPDGKAWRPIKQFYAATSGDVKNVQITRAYRDELVGKQVRADIVKRAKRKQVDGEWQDDGWENILDNFRKVD